MGWTTLSRQLLLENNWIQLFEDQVENPGGGTHDYTHVHFKNLAVAIIPIDAHDHTWLVGQSRYTLDAYSWELPMGGAPLSEAPLDAAQRELREETGISAARWSEFMRLHTSNSVTDELGIVYLATETTVGMAQPEETEDITVRRMPVDHAIQLAFDGVITDAISVAALLRLSAMRTMRRPSPVSDKD